MKKILSILLSMSIILSMATVISVGAEENLVFSENFENGLSSWTPAKESHLQYFKIADSGSNEGKKHLKLQDNIDSETVGIESNSFDATPDTVYTIKYDAKVDEGKGCKIYIQFKDSSGKILYSKSMYASGSNWKTFSQDHVSPAGTVKGNLIIWGQDTVLGTSSFDNIRVYKGAAAPQEEKTPEVSTKVGETIFTEDFENGLDRWVILSMNSDPEASKIESENVKDGKASLRVIDKDGDVAFGVRTKTNIPVKENTKYVVSADIFNKEGSAARIFFLCLDKDGNRILNKSYGANGTGKWENVTFSEVTPAGTVALQIHLTGSKVGLGETFIDNFKISVGEEDPNSILISKLQSLKPGDTYEIEDCIYEDVQIVLKENATSDKPITIKAKNPGKVVFKGTSNFNITGSYYILDGLRFEECTNKNLVYFDVASKNCSLKNSAFINCDSKEGSQFQVQLRGEAMTVDSCYFAGKSTVGQFIECARSESKKEVGAKHLIRNCYFGNIKFQSGNGYEAVRLGLSETCFDDYSVILEGCFFEKCDGESETISVKGNGTQIRYNTFYNNMGAVVLRHGNDCSVYGNMFIGGEKTTRLTGVRITGERQKVYNNYFYNLTPTSTSLIIFNGNPYEKIENHYYYPVVDADIHNNTFLGGDKIVIVGQYSPSETSYSSNLVIAPKGKFYNNAVLSYTGKNELVKNGDENHEIKFDNNFLYGKPMGYIGDMTGLNYENFPYEIKENYFVPANGIGADIEEIKKAPKSPFDIIPEWVKTDLYDTGIMKFEPVKGDPFNTDFKVENLLPNKDKVNVIINGYIKEFDVDPQLINSRTMVPMRAIFEEFGAEVSWDEATATATADLGNITVKITENSDKAYVNDKETTLDSPAVIINGRFLVPLRFISESFGAHVGWADATQTAMINFETSVITGNFDNIVRPVKHNIENALEIKSSMQSGDDGTGNDVSMIFDGSLDTRWAFNKDDGRTVGYGIFDLGSSKVLESIYLGFYNANVRTYNFSIFVSEDNKTYTPVKENIASTVKTTELEKFDLGNAKGRYLKIVGHGNSQNEWNNITEMIITGK